MRNVWRTELIVIWEYFDSTQIMAMGEKGAELDLDGENRKKMIIYFSYFPMLLTIIFKSNEI